MRFLKNVLDVPLEQEEKVREEIDKGMSEEAQNAVIGAARILQSFREEDGMDNALIQLAEMLGYNQPQAETEMDNDINKQEQETPEIPEEVKKQFEALTKAQDEAVAKAKELEEVLKAERDERLTKEYIAKAKEEYENIPGKTSEELGKILKSLNESDAEAAKEIEEILKATNAIIAKSELFVEAGKTTQETEDDAYGKLNNMAKKLSQDTNISYAKAFTQIMEANPDLYAEYIQGN